MKPVIVFDNIVYSLQKSGGISAFWSNLTKRVEVSGLFDCRYVEYPGASDNIFRRELEIPLERIVRGRHLPFGVERILEPLLPPDILKRPFLFHSSYYRTFTHRNALNVATFHDLTHEHGGDGNFLTRPLMRRQHENAIANSRHIVCVSHCTREDVKATFPKYVDTPMSVAYNAPVNYEDKGTENIPVGDYLLFVGARDDYKNFRFAVALAARCAMKLRVAGAPFSSTERRMIAALGADVDLHVFPDNAEMCRLYSGARALVFMSEFEGFGIPIAEAQSLGCPVIGLRRSAVPEIAGDGAILFDHIDMEKASEAVKRLADPEFRSRLKASGKENVRRFDWDRTAAQYIAVYRSLLASRR